jgi:hypothetical protein
VKVIGDGNPQVSNPARPGPPALCLRHTCQGSTCALFESNQKDRQGQRRCSVSMELQALQLALGYLRAKLQQINEASGAQLRWLGDENGDLGIRLPDF